MRYGSYAAAATMTIHNTMNVFNMTNTRLIRAHRTPWQMTSVGRVSANVHIKTLSFSRKRPGEPPKPRGSPLVDAAGVFRPAVQQLLHLRRALAADADGRQRQVHVDARSGIDHVRHGRPPRRIHVEPRVVGQPPVLQLRDADARVLKPTGHH